MRPGQDALLDDAGIHMAAPMKVVLLHKDKYGISDSDSIFHAGDLNWWHWLGDTPENNTDASAWLGVSSRIRWFIRRCSDVLSTIVWKDAMEWCIDFCAVYGE